MGARTVAPGYWSDVVVASHRAIRAFNEHMRPVLERAGFSHLGIGNVLFLLTVGEGGARVADLVRDQGFLGSNVSYAMTSLAEVGLLEREADLGDRRVRQVRLTPRGLALLADLRAASAGDVRDVGAALSSASVFLERFAPPVERRARPSTGG